MAASRKKSPARRAKKKKSAAKKSRKSTAAKTSKRPAAKKSSRKKSAGKKTGKRPASRRGKAALTGAENALTDVARSIGSTLGNISARAKQVVKDATERFESD